ncbi:unnamed protein product [Cuscuta epithymum]|nr:unnamed protein product [Cuscuta epithymum]CAH9147003.1 unnamed protein product [Cuscuta epithymum]
MFQMKTSHTDPDTQFSGKESKIRELRLEPLTGRSLKYCTDACLRRCLEARNWNVEKAKKMLEETLKWRSMYKPEEIRWVSNFGVGVTPEALFDALAKTLTV